MVIDFHTHVFPDKIADAALQGLAKKVETLLTPVHNGRLSSLLNCMDESGVDVSVVQPVVTKQAQVEKNNEWAASIQSERIICFGGVFPPAGEWKKDIDKIVSLGLKGIKLHPEYQGFTPDSDELLRLYDYALDRGLIVLIHGGVDVGMPPPYRATPRAFKNIIRQLKGGVIVAAHLGGHAMWEEVYEVLAGEDIYLDTSMGFEYYGGETFLRILEKHGAERILFASDSPWSNQGEEIKRLKALPIAQSDIEKILWKNAKRLLKL
jgi:predicted TIM-barrel fold metal-dependent hydrolase